MVPSKITLPIFAALLVSLFFTLASAATFQVRNNCPFTVWAAGVPGGGRQLNRGDTWIINANPGTVQARIWARTNCQFDASGRGRCQTGDCNGLLNCQGFGAAPNTLAEYALDQFMHLDFIDISVIDGFNVPMEFSSVSGQCSRVIKCTGDLIGQCPNVLRVPCHGGHEIDIKNKEVVVSPDFIIYGDMYCAESRLTFSCSCIKLKGATLNGFKQAFSLEWAIDDIVNIRSDWCGKVETAVVNLLLKIKDSKRAGNVNGIPGFDLLKFAVYDPYWFEGQEAIESLNVRYRDIWNITTDSYGGNENAFSVSGHISRPYFSDFPEPFEEIVYPKGDPDAVSISQRDVELLQPDTFINDTIIDFYIKYLKNKILPDEQHRFHFFNSFFFRKLADIDKDPHSACEGREAFKRVRKWTRKVNLFEKDYIFVPVNYSLHWSLIVICHPGEAAHFRDEEIKQSLKVPCILHMDSIKGSHRGLKNLFQSYLCEEWKERNKETRDDVLSKFLHLRFVSLELPQQENSFDCGLFLLHYVERFLEEAPANFSPFMITRFSCFLTRDWFLPMEASLKRAYIQKLIYGILEDYSHEIPEAGCPDKYFSSLLPNGNEVEVQVNEDQKLLQFARPNEVDDRCKPEFPSTSNDEFANFVVEDSEEQSVMHDDNESKDVSSSQKNILTMSNQGIDQNENYCISNDEDLASEPKGQQAGAKRSRLMPP